MVDFLKSEVVHHVYQLSDDVSTFFGGQGSVFVHVIEKINISGIVLHNKVPGILLGISVDVQ